VDFTTDKSLLKNQIAPLTAKDPNTLLYQGMVQAMDLARRLDVKPLRRAIVMLTDGMDDQQGGAGRQQATDAMSIDPVPIYAIGASDRSPRVDAALKDFAALVYASGGAYRRVEVLKGPRPSSTMLAQNYSELRDVVAQTHHFTADCKPCNPDGSPIAVRLRLTQGAVEVNSGTVTVLSVGTKGKAEPRPPPPPPPAPTQVAQEPQPPSPPRHIEEPPPWWLRWTINIGFFLKLPWQWLVLAGVALAAAIAGLLAILLPKSSPPPETRIFPEPGPTRPASEPGPGIIVIDTIRPGTQLQSRRLRMTPLGQNDLPSQERPFEGELSVGRSGDNQIIINNDTQVSGKHCTLSPKDGLILVRDEESRNGTRVNGVPIAGFIHAEPDSVLGVGRTELRLQLLAPGQQ
jgi:hypothetical protein